MRIFDILLAKKLAGGGGGGTMPDEYCIGGSLYNKTLVKYHFPTESVGNNLRDYYFSGCQQLEAIENFPTTATSIPYNFASCFPFISFCRKKAYPGTGRNP